MQKNEVRILTLYHVQKINSKRIKDQNGKAKTIELLESIRKSFMILDLAISWI